MFKFFSENMSLSKEDNDLLVKHGQELYDKVKKMGGFIKACCTKELPECLQGDWFDFYKRTLLNYEYEQVVNGSNIGKPHYYTFQEMLDIYSQNSLAWLKYQISIFSLDSKATEMLNIFFTKEALSKNHGSQNIDIRQQQINYDQFQPARMNQQLEGMTIKDYIDYLNEPEKFIKRQEIAADQRLFAVNVNMQGWNREINYLKQFLPKCLRPQGHNDGLSYLRQEIDGVNIPQIYIKTEGVWTGGHQENLSVNAININHGPADCIWITVDNEYVPMLSKLIKDEMDVDILKLEGLWFKEPLYFLKQEIPFRYTLQKKGDIVILGAGCLHWVKSLGQTINSAWNQVALDEKSLLAMSQRHQINRQINYRTVIPYKNLMLDIYIHEKNLEQKTIQRLQSELQEFFDYENQKLQQMNAKASLVECCKEVQLCTKCGHEIFLYFYHDQEEYLCLDCVQSRPFKQQLKIALKYRFHSFYYILQSQPTQCDPEYCCPYTGKTKCSVQQQLKPEYKGSGFKFKKPQTLNSMLHGGDKIKRKKVDRLDYEIDNREQDKVKHRRHKQQLEGQPIIKRMRNH